MSSKPFAKGDLVDMRVHGHSWMRGRIILASENQQSLAVGFDHFGPLLETGSFVGPDGPVVLLMHDGAGYMDIATTKRVEVRAARGNGD